MVAHNLTNYLNVKDGNNVVVASWAEATGTPGVARCKWCDAPVKFGGGKSALTNHSESNKHKKAAPKKDSTTHQITLQQSLEASSAHESEKEEIDRKRREFEICLVRSLSNHNVSMSFLDCLTESLKKYCGDSKVVEAMKLHRYKGEVMARNGIGKSYQEETILMMRTCDAFSIGFDESEINKTSELEIMANIAVPGQCVQLRHYRTLDLDSGTAPSIVASLLAQFAEDGIDYKKKLVSTMTDGCNTMQGHIGGVKKLLSEQVPQLVDLGSCNDHHISNALKHGVKEFDSDVQEALVHVYQDIGGAKGRGLKKKKEFENVCESIGLKPIPFKRFCSTRFRIIRDCIKPVLHNWEGIVKYYSTLTKPTDRQKLLKSYFVDREWLSLLKINFINSAIRELIEGIDYFEQRSLLAHEVRQKMEKILRSQVLKFHNENVVKTADDELLHSTKKSGTQLLDIDFDDKSTRLSRRAVFVGQEVTKLLKTMTLHPKCAQLDSFFEAVYNYHLTVAKHLVKYFKVGLKSTELEYMGCFSPSCVDGLYTSHQMKYLVQKYSKVVENIEPSEGLDRIREEIESCTVDEDVLLLKNKNFEEFWKAVADLTEGDGWVKYPLLPRFVMAMATMFNSNSEIERAFSVQTDIHRNPKRNLMMQETLEGHMQIHFGVEGQATKENCDKCLAYKLSQKKAPAHCHCAVAAISDDMVQDVKKVWQAESNRQKLQKEMVEEEDTAAAAKKEACQQASTIRALKFVTGLKTRKTFYTPELMLPVFVGKKSRLNVEDELDAVVTKEKSSVDTGKKRKNAVDICPSTIKKKTPSKQGSTSTKDSSVASSSSQSTSGTSELTSQKQQQKMKVQCVSNQKTLNGYRIPKKPSGGGDSTEKTKKQSGGGDSTEKTKKSSGGGDSTEKTKEKKKKLKKLQELSDSD